MNGVTNTCQTIQGDVNMRIYLHLVILATLLSLTAAQRGNVDCYVCGFLSNSTDGTNRGTPDCMRPDDPDAGIELQTCPGYNAACESFISITYQYLHIVRRCSTLDSVECVHNSTRRVNNLWTNITECCTTRNCNDRTAYWFDVAQHSDDHVSAHACTNGPVELHDSGTVFSPLTNWARRTPETTQVTSSPFWEASTAWPDWDYEPGDDIAVGVNGAYPNRADCSWRLLAQTGYIISLDFNYLLMEGPADGCPFDALKIYDGPSESSPLIHIFCGQQSIPDNTVVSTSNRLFLKFKTDSSVTYPGFELRFYAVHESTLPISNTGRACSGVMDPPVLGGTAGMFHSPWDHQRHETPDSATTARPMRTTPRGDPNPYPTPDGGNTDDGPDGEVRTCGSDNNCQNGGSCYIRAADIICECLQGFAGHFCETTELRETCSGDICQNGGSCVVESGFARCNCPTGYSGLYCQQDDICLQPYDVGDCEYYEQRYYYSSRRGMCMTFYYSGCGGNHNRFNTREGCEHECIDSRRDPCESNPCEHDSTCTTSAQDYVCQCPERFTGYRCESPVAYNHCNDVCENGGTCQLMYGEALCECAAGYAGIFCQEEYDPCASNPCLEGGTCMVEGHYPYCVCTAGHTGDQCQFLTHLRECESFLCQNGGRCVDVGYDLECVCISPYTGYYCETEIPGNNGTNPWHWPTDGTGGAGGYYYHDYYDDYYYDNYYYDTYYDDYDYSGDGANAPNYPNNANCRWNIEVASDQHIQIQFLHINMERSTQCIYDRIDILDMRGNVIAGPFCGSHHEAYHIATTESAVQVQFITDGSATGRGFVAHYRAVDESIDRHTTPTPPRINEACGSGQPLVVSGEVGNIWSPVQNGAGDIYGNYPNNAECTWRIEVNDHEHIEVTFYRFELEYSSTCTYDALRVFDGPTTQSTMLGTYCGSEVPDAIVSSASSLFLRFNTDGSIVRFGFELGYRAIRSVFTLPPTVRHEIFCFLCIHTVYANGDEDGDPQCTDPEGSQTDIELCSGQCRTRLTQSHRHNEVHRSCSYSCEEGVSGDLDEHVTTLCCSGHDRCNDAESVRRVHVEPTSAPDAPTEPIWNLPDEPTLPTAMFTVPKPSGDMHNCYSCAYAASGKVVGGRECLDPEAANSVDTAICSGKCYTKKSIMNNADGVADDDPDAFRSIERGCDDMGEACHDSNWIRDDMFYEETCCVGELCNKDHSFVEDAASHVQCLSWIMYCCVGLLMMLLL